MAVAYRAMIAWPLVSEWLRKAQASAEFGSRSGAQGSPSVAVAEIFEIVANAGVAAVEKLQVCAFISFLARTSPIHVFHAFYSSSQSHHSVATSNGSFTPLPLELERIASDMWEGSSAAAAGDQV